MVMVNGTRVDIPQHTVGSPTSTSAYALPVLRVNFLQLTYVPKDVRVRGGWKLASTLMVEIKLEDDHEFVASVPSLNEYGIGATVEAALDDLLSSLVDYMESLLRREAKLSQPLKIDLDILKKLLTK